MSDTFTVNLFDICPRLGIDHFSPVFVENVLIVVVGVGPRLGTNEPER